MKQTKEQLLAENARLTAQLKATLELDEAQRKEFSGVLNAPMGEDYYRNTRTTYSWGQIFCEVGKLIAANEITRLRESADQIYREKSDLSYQLEMARRNPEPK